MEMKIADDSDEFYNFIISNTAGKNINIIPIFREGDMNQLREALKLNLFDIISFPPYDDVVRRKISLALMNNQNSEKERG